MKIQTFEVKDNIDTEKGKLHESASDATDDAYGRCSGVPIGVLKIVTITVDEMEEDKYRAMEDVE
jgi:hypothetical protein